LERIHTLYAKGQGAPDEIGGGGDLADKLAGKGGSAKRDGTRLEKMGFVFGGGRGASDHAKKTAANTAKTNELLGKLVARRFDNTGHGENNLFTNE
jgi:hypothetical protein